MKKVILALGCCLLTCLPLLAQDYVQLTDLPTIYIETENNQPITSKEDYLNAVLHYVDADGVTTYDALGVRGRGNSTWYLAKKPYRIKFDSKQEFMGPDRANAKSWTLLANMADKTLIRNAVAACIGSFAGQPFTAGAQFVDLVLNGTYLGNYQLSDQMEVRKKRVDIDEQDEVPAEDANITGGYFLEVDGFATAEPVYFRTNRNVLITVKSPDDDIIVQRQLDYIKGHIQAFEDALFSENFTDPELGYRPYVDSLTLASWYISTELTGNVDGFWSTYIYKKKDDQRIYWGPLWDYDIAFNNCVRVGDVSQSLMINKGFGSDLTMKWVLQMWKDPWFIKLINRTWQECVERGIEEHVVNYIDSMAAVLERSQAMNFEKWPIGERAYDELVLFSTYQEGIDYLKAFVSNHCAFLTKIFAQAEENMGNVAEATPEFVADENFFYRISNRGSGNSFDIAPDSSSVCTWAHTRGKESQQWEVVPKGDYFHIVNRATGLALSDEAKFIEDGIGGYVKGSQVVTKKLRSSSYRQQWSFVPVNTGNCYVIVNRLTGLALNNEGGSTDNGTRVLSWTNDNENAFKDTRQWRVEKDDAKEDETVTVGGVASPGVDYAVLYNPQTKQLRFASNGALAGDAALFAEDGSCVMRFAVSQTASLGHLGQGVYILRWVVPGGEAKSVKFLVR